MSELNVFVSVGGPATDKQEAFVRAVEDRLRIEGFIPHTVGRNAFSSDAPLKTITELLDKCSATVVIALERTYFASGLEKRGGLQELPLSDIKLATPWNQIEAAMAYSRGHPLMVIMEIGLKSEGLLERGNDWYVQWVNPDSAALSTPEFNGVIASWKQKVLQQPKKLGIPKPPSELTISELIGGLKASQLWSVLGALIALAGGAFALGAKLLSG
jgi:hypothetical protein